MTALTNKWRALVACILLVLLAFLAANFYLGLGFFGRQAKLILVSVMVVGIVWISFFAPTRGEGQKPENHSKGANGPQDERDRNQHNG